MIRRRGGDTTVAALLRQLPVPEHADDFFDRLRAQLYAESDVSVDTAASTVIDLSVRRGDRRQERSRTQRMLRSATAPAAAVACFVLVVGGGLLARRTAEERQRPSGAAPATARDFTAAKNQRFVVPQPYTPAKTGVRVRFGTNMPGHVPNREVQVQSFEGVISPAGDYHLSRVAPSIEVNFSAQSGSRTMYQVVKGKPSVLYQSDLPLGPPEPPDQANLPATLSRDLGAAVRAINAERPADVKRTERLGRPALEMTDQGSGGTLFQKQHVIVDVRTGFPLLVEQWKADGTLYRTLDVTEIVDDQPIPASMIAPPLPTATTQSTESKHFAASTLADVAKAVGYQPLVPLSMPAGFELARVATAPSLDPVDGQTNPAYADVVALVYRRGLDTVTVTTRRAAPAGALGSVSAPGVVPAPLATTAPLQLKDPLVQGTPLPDMSQPTTISTGALAGDVVNVGIYPVVWPHVWAQHGDLIITIAGDLNRRELLQVAGSLQAYVH
ncbi:MAG: hypothetical protein ABI912_06075 [Actinomycetota bacterium]